MKATTCPNLFPTRPSARRIAIIGEACGSHELSWVTCEACHHSFSSEYTDLHGTKQDWKHCDRCGGVLLSTPTPFVGPAGRLLGKLLDEVGIQRTACFIGNVGQVVPPKGDPRLMRWNSDPVVLGLAQLQKDLERFQPEFCLVLGGIALRAIHGGKVKIDDYRGSLFESNGIIKGVKCLATYHPARLLREQELTGIVRFDMQKAIRECKTDTIPIPVRDIQVMLPSAGWTVERVKGVLAELRTARLPTAFDIEGYARTGVTCYSLANEVGKGYVVPFETIEGASVWSEDEEVEIWKATRDLLEDPLVPKVAQNCLYDCFVLAWTYGIVVRNLAHDTMLSHFELYPEFPKALGFQASVYTNEPFYKSERKSGNDMVAFTYCGKDSCVTLECHQVMMRQMQPRQREHYLFNMSMLPCLLYMELRGMRFDYEKAQQARRGIKKRIHALQDRINREVVSARPDIRAYIDATLSKDGEGLAALLPLLIEAFCAKKSKVKVEVEETSWQAMRWNGKKWVKAGKRITDPAFVGVEGPELVRHTRVVMRNVAPTITTLADVRRFSRDSCRSKCRRACALAAALIRGKGTPARRGELATLLGVSLKIRASGRDQDQHDEVTGETVKGEERDANWFLYTYLKFPPQYTKEGTRNTNRLASNDEAVTKGWCKTKDRRAIWFLTLKRLLTSLKYYEALPDPDKRMRFGLNLVGTPTGRMAAYGSPTRTSKVNPQTIPKKARELYIADEGCVIGQYDLSGSDTWSVAAYCASLGDDTMLQDNLAQLKPAKITALIYDDGKVVNTWTRPVLKIECKKIGGESWLYFASKRIVHGSDYGMGPITMSNQILTDSYKLTGKPIWLEPATCKKIQEEAFFVRYPGVRKWHNWMARELKEIGELTACNGFRRRFYGRKDDPKTLNAALAHIPQVITTYSINLMVQRMWTDPTNRRVDGSLRIEPLLCVHDSVIEQWRVEDMSYAKVKLKEWFNNEVSVKGVEFTIPAEGGAGPNWLHQGTEKWAAYGGIDL